MKITSKNIKQFTFFIMFLVALSALIIFSITHLLRQRQIELPWYISAPSISGVYVLLFYAFDMWGWRLKVLRLFSGLNPPNLNGSWTGTGKSSYDNFKNEYEVSLEINQRATNVVVRGMFKESNSVSLNAGFEPSDIDGCDALFYFYRNHPKVDATETMAIHEGSAKLIYDPKTDTIEGSYYSGRDRNNYGTWHLSRSNENHK